MYSTLLMHTFLTKETFFKSTNICHRIVRVVNLNVMFLHSFYSIVKAIKGQVLYFRNPSWVVSQNTILGTEIVSILQKGLKRISNSYKVHNFFKLQNLNLGS